MKLATKKPQTGCSKKLAGLRLESEGDPVGAPLFLATAALAWPVSSPFGCGFPLEKLVVPEKPFGEHFAWFTPSAALSPPPPARRPSLGHYGRASSLVVFNVSQLAATFSDGATRGLADRQLSDLEPSNFFPISNG